LRKSYQFQEVKRNGTKYKTDAFWIQGLLVPRQNSPILGIIATRRLGKAVDRNRAKRVLREVFRRNLKIINPSLQIIVLPRSPIFNSSFLALEKKFIYGLEKISS